MFKIFLIFKPIFSLFLSEEEKYKKSILLKANKNFNPVDKYFTEKMLKEKQKNIFSHKFI